MGLVQHRIEAAGLCTISLSPMAEVTAAYGVPRVAAVEHPFTQTVGRVGDAEGQRAVLLATLEALESAERPGEVAHLPFTWPEPRGQAVKSGMPDRHPPIVGYLKRKPWLMARFLRGKVPGPSRG